MAFELAQSVGNEIKPLIDAHGGIRDILPQYFNIMCDTDGIDSVNRERSTDQYNLPSLRFGQELPANTLSLLNGYQVANGGDTVVTTYDGKFGWYDEELGGIAETSRGKLDQDRAALMEILPDLQFLASNLGRGAVEDELIRGVGKLMDFRSKASSCPMWLAFAFQVYLDILQNMGKICDEGHVEMRQVTIRAQESMVHVPKSPERQKVLRAAKKWDTDPIKTSRDYMVALGLTPDRDVRAFKTLDRNPMYCRLIIHNIRCTMHYQGVTYAATPGAIMSVSQLYYALRQEGLLPQDLVWEDLETFVSMPGNGTFFVGNQPPTDREGYYKTFGLCLGISTSNRAPSKRKNKKVNLHAGNRHNMKFKGFTSLMANNRIVPSAVDLPPSTAEVIRHVLESGRRHALLDSKGHVRPDAKTKAAEAARYCPDELTPVGLIRTLAEDINAEVPDLNFDIFTLHNKVWDLLQSLRDHIRELYGPLIDLAVPRPDRHPLIVGYVFATAAGRIDVNAGPPQEQRDGMLLAAGALCVSSWGRATGASSTIARRKKWISINEWRAWNLRMMIRGRLTISRGRSIRRVWLARIAVMSVLPWAYMAEARDMKQGQIRTLVRIFWDTHV